MVVPPPGAIVLVRFPFSDLSQAKLRPAVVLADVGHGDQILCQITSKPYGDARAVQLHPTGFVSGSLQVVSYVQPGKLFTANSDLVTRQVAVLKSETFKSVIDAIVNLLRGMT